MVFFDDFIKSINNYFLIKMKKYFIERITFINFFMFWYYFKK